MAIANDGLFGTILKKNPYIIIKRINIKLTIVSVSHEIYSSILLDEVVEDIIGQIKVHREKSRTSTE